MLRGKLLWFSSLGQRVQFGVFLEFCKTFGVELFWSLQVYQKLERQEQSMNNHSSQKSNQSQSITMKTQPIVPDRLRAEKQTTYLEEKELEAEEMSKIEGGAFVETKKIEKSRIVPKKMGLRGILSVFPRFWTCFGFSFRFGRAFEVRVF